VVSEIVIITKTLDDFLAENMTTSDKFEFLILDTQGSELEILKGGLEFLQEVKYVLCEVSERELYKEGAHHSEIKLFLKQKGFEEMAFRINRETGWGDAFFVKSEIAKSLLQNGISTDFKYEGRKFAPGILLRNLMVRLHLK
jgi:hypothetical protein